MQSNLHQGDAEGETRRTQASGEDSKSSIVVHAHEFSHMINLDGARAKRSGMTGYWQRTTKAIHIKLSEKTINLDGGL